jgi:hypothetical protein
LTELIGLGISVREWLNVDLDMRHLMSIDPVATTDTIDGEAQRLHQGGEIGEANVVEVSAAELIQ